MKARNDVAMDLLCRMLETPGRMVRADGARLSDHASAYRHLLDIGALVLGDALESDVLCPSCISHALRPSPAPEGGYRGYCARCGWVALPRRHVKPVCALPHHAARRLAAALGLADRYECRAVLEGTLWRLGEIEHRRRRRTVFFGSQLERRGADVQRCIAQHAAPGAAVVLTSGDVGALPASLHPAVAWVPLRAIAHLSKAGFVIENLKAYLDQPPALETTNETSLRLLHSQRVALIDGEQHKLSPQVYQFLSLLEKADGKALHKRAISDKLEIAVDTFKAASIFKRHKEVYGTFVDSDGEGRYWIKGNISSMQRDPPC